MMAAFVNRTALLMSGDGLHVNHTDHYALPSTTSRPPIDNSPLQIFVRAKKKINHIFSEIDQYIGDVCDFAGSLSDNDGELRAKEAAAEAASFKDKVHGIRDVLLRDHMKVAFFGRTSNGKSTVINAMLREKVLPSGIGHTTNCFLQVEGADTNEAYLVTEQSDERRNVASVSQLAHALCKEKLSENELVRVYWPRDKCSLLRDDVVLVDSPGVDVSPNLDEWIDKHCLDADVFVLVANAESTLMLTEKNFFHKVSQKLSKPNIFVLHNRWDASANEPEFLEQVRSQHQERAIDFLSRELSVCSEREAEARIFFVSAKEALQARNNNSGGGGEPPSPCAPLAEGHQTRLFEFQDFERRFEECISRSAVKTKFEQHADRGKAIAATARDRLDALQERAQVLKARDVDRRDRVRLELEETERQLVQVTKDMKERIGRVVEDVEQRVSRALSEEIRRLSVLVDEFSVPFHPEPLVLNVYKKELHAHVERGLGSNMRSRLGAALQANMDTSQREMVLRMESLVSAERRALLSRGKEDNHPITGGRPFEVLYRLNCDNLCADFQERLDFRFTWGPAALLRKMAAASCKPETIQARAEDWSVATRLAVCAAGGPAVAQGGGTVGVCIVTGFLLKTVGWRALAFVGAVYGSLYLYERLTWTNKAKERLFKRQYVDHATKKLRLIVDLTSANCSHQVQQELSGTFARLCSLVDDATSGMNDELQRLDRDVRRLDEAAAQAKVLRNTANYLTHELDLFQDAYLKSQP